MLAVNREYRASLCSISRRPSSGSVLIDLRLQLRVSQHHALQIRRARSSPCTASPAALAFLSDFNTTPSPNCRARSVTLTHAQGCRARVCWHAVGNPVEMSGCPGLRTVTAASCAIRTAARPALHACGFPKCICGSDLAMTASGDLYESVPWQRRVSANVELVAGGIGARIPT